MTEIEKAAIEFLDADDKTIPCVHCRDDYICTDHRDKHRSTLQTLRRLVREKQGRMVRQTHRSSISLEDTLRI